MEESASMLCARVVRGINSTENEVTPLPAIASTVSIDPSGRMNPTSPWPVAQERNVFMARPIVRAVAEDLDDDVRGLEYVTSSGHDLGPPSGIVGVRIAGLRAGPRLHDDLEARFQKARDDRGHQGHTPFTRVALARDADDHESSPSG